MPLGRSPLILTLGIYITVIDKKIASISDTDIPWTTRIKYWAKSKNYGPKQDY